MGSGQNEGTIGPISDFIIILILSIQRLLNTWKGKVVGGRYLWPDLGPLWMYYGFHTKGSFGQS